MQEPVLLVMAAGMGSRYGGLKQIDPVGKNGEIIIDYSLYDAVRAGFKRAVFIVKEENLQDFKDIILPKAGDKIDIDFVCQKLTDIPAGCSIPEGRIKPWGTGHAVLTAASVIDAPFVVINADDFYGQEAFSKMYQFLKNATETKIQQYAMVGYLLKNTVTENGSVARGICETENGKLKTIVERTRIEKCSKGIAFTENGGETWTELPPDTIVSMNLFGFTPRFFETLREAFHTFFKRDVPQNPLKSEYFLPFVVNDMIASGRAEVTVLSSKDQWHGVTYKEDKEQVVNAILKMTEDGIYSSPLWQ